MVVRLRVKRLQAALFLSVLAACSVPVLRDSGSSLPVVDLPPADEPQVTEAQLAEEALTAAVELMNQAQSEIVDTQPLIHHEQQPTSSPTPMHIARVESLCNEIGAKLGSVSVNDCSRQNLVFADGFSVQERVLVKKDFLPANSVAGISNNRILVIGGIHGDEYSSVSIMFRWMELLSSQQGTDFYWRFLPLTNPDGLLARNATRQNANGVDLNRNFPSDDWNATAIEAWKRTTGSNPRRYPGPHAASEPETQWILRQMEEFDPLVIVSVHAPHDLLDFDGHVEAPRRIGMLQLNQLGVYPGSLGNYGGLDRGIPVITLELPSAGIMPNAREIQNMWVDLQDWLIRRAADLANARSVAGD
jgi:murein peptide amidase A